MSKQLKKVKMECNPCRSGNCEGCVNILLIVLGRDEICQCTRKNHAGEPHGAPEHVCNETCAIVNGNGVVE